MGVATTYKRPSERLAMFPTSREHSTATSCAPRGGLAWLFWPALALAMVLLAAGCRSPAPRPSLPETRDIAVDPLAAAIARAERQAAPAARAASLLQALLQAWPTSPQQAADLSARLLASAGRPALAAALPQRQRFELHAIAAEMALGRGDEAEAERLVALLAPVDARQASAAAWLRARVFDLRGDRQAAAETLATMLATESPIEPARAAATVWRRLSKMSSFDLQGLARTGSNPSMRAWAALARELNTALTQDVRAEVWRRWRTRHPQHAAARFPPVDLGDRAAPRRIAALLPVTGDLADLGAAIRDGLLAAYLHAQPQDQRLIFFDTGALSAREAYERAVAAGAELIVGPLDKAAVAALAGFAPRLPVVALNTPEADAAAMPANMVQMALAVEDQAEAVAKALRANGVERVALFLNDSAWAARARERLQREPGIDIAVASALQGVGEVIDVAAAALAVTESVARHAELEALTAATLTFTPRPRDDVDAVVAFVEQTELLALKPALNFHFAGELPVYVWSRVPRRGLGGRLDGVYVCDIPWRLHPHALREQAEAAFGARAASPLFALGVDGYRVANQLARLTLHGESIAGGTGVLTLADDGRVRRELAWAKAVGDHLVPLPGW